MKKRNDMLKTEIIEELKELIEMASFKIACEDGTEENYTVVEISDIERLIDKLQNDFVIK